VSASSTYIENQAGMNCHLVKAPQQTTA